MRKPQSAITKSKLDNFANLKLLLATKAAIPNKIENVKNDF